MAASNIQHNGSDRSLESSSTSAMEALMNLASFNIPGAVSNGYQAYGKFRNSEDLDYTSDVNHINSLSLASASDSNSNAALKNFKPTDTTFSRLDSSYLRKGEAAEVASRFEKQSGMSRDEFHKLMGEMSDSKISANDPQMVDKVLGRFEKFVSHIPNDEFRNNLQKAIDSVPSTVRTGVLAKAVTQFAGMFASGDDSGAADVAAIADTNSSPSTGASSAVNAEAPATAAEEPGRAPASASGESYRIASVGRAPNSALWGILENALAKPGAEDTIFIQVSRRYRNLEPRLAQKP